MPNLTNTIIDKAIATGTSERRIWDERVPSLGVRIKPSGVASFFVQYTSPVSGKKVRHTLGRYGVLTIAKARKKAVSVLGQVADNKDPHEEQKQALKMQRSAVSFEEFCHRYLEDCRNGLVLYRGRPKKLSTIEIDEGRIRRHLVPLLGKLLIKDINQSDALAAMHAITVGKTAATEKTEKLRGLSRVTGGPGTARRAIGLLGSIMSHAQKLGLREDNPVKGIERSQDGRRQRILSRDEYKRLGWALADLEASGSNPVAINAIRALALTGCRKGEILSLRHEAVDRDSSCLRLADTKSGPQVRPIGARALKLLTGIEHEGPYLFPASSASGHLIDPTRLLANACRKANIEGVTLHTLRHSYASCALELEYSEFTIAGLLGHRGHSTTSRYAHHADKALVGAADQVAGKVAERLGL